MVRRNRFLTCGRWCRTALQHDLGRAGWDPAEMEPVPQSTCRFFCRVKHVRVPESLLMFPKASGQNLNSRATPSAEVSMLWTHFLYQEAGRYLSPLLNSFQNLIIYLFWKQNMCFYTQAQHVIQTHPKLTQEWLEENFSRFWPLAWDRSLCFCIFALKI